LTCNSKELRGHKLRDFFVKCYEIMDRSEVLGNKSKDLIRSQRTINIKGTMGKLMLLGNKLKFGMRSKESLWVYIEPIL